MIHEAKAGEDTERATELHAPAPRRGQKKKRRWTFGLLACFLGFLGACIGAEILVLLLAGEQPKFPRHVVGAPWGVRRNEPGAHYRHKSADMTTWFRINQQGMRDDRDFSYEKPAGVKRIVALGDSYTIGYEVDVDETFSRVLERRLRETGLQVEVLNTGVSGFSTAEELVSLERQWIKYDPDLVLVAFCSNDLVDNVRTGLFRIEGDVLVEAEKDYVPAGGIGDFLNRNSLFNWLSERSNAFCFFKERITRLLKRSMVQENLANLDADEDPTPEQESTPDTGRNERRALQRRMTSLLFERMYEQCRDRGVPLVIMSIPTQRQGPRGPLVDRFPIGELDTDRPGLLFVPAKEILEGHLDEHLLYWQQSHFHWTPFSHERVGEELARRILAEKLLPR